MSVVLHSSLEAKGGTNPQPSSLGLLAKSMSYGSVTESPGCLLVFGTSHPEIIVTVHAVASECPFP